MYTDKMYTDDVDDDDDDDESHYKDAEPSNDGQVLRFNEVSPSEGGESSIAIYWRSQLQPSRERIVNKIIETLKKRLAFTDEEGLQEVIVKFEAKVYMAATSQSDYLRRISLKMLSMEVKPQNTMANAVQYISADSFLKELIPIFLDQSSEELDSTAKTEVANGDLGQQNMMDLLQPISYVDLGQQTAQNSLHQVSGVSIQMTPPDTSSEWTFLFASFVLEILSAACEQLSSRNQLFYARTGMLFAIAAVLTCIWELVDKAMKERVVLRWSGMLCLPHYPHPRNAPCGTFADFSGLACALCQCIFATLQYVYVRRGSQNPIKFSLLPLVFLMILACSRSIRSRVQRHTVDEALDQNV